MKYQVYVGNIGQVYDGFNKKKALEIYYHYVDESKTGWGRASEEDVAIFEDEDVLFEYFGKKTPKNS